MKNSPSKQEQFWDKLATLTPPQRLLVSYLLAHSESAVVEKFWGAVEEKPRKYPVFYDFTHHKWVGVETIMGELRKLFPSVDIDRELATMQQWLERDPVAHRKKNYRKFIMGWLSRSVARNSGESPEDWAKRVLSNG